MIQELTLPLRHEDIIRQQAKEKGVDAALIAAVIYSESKFSDQTSSAGARGLMQITPETARDVERHSGGTTFKIGDLSDPEINIRYGTFRCANCSIATTATRSPLSPRTTPVPATSTGGAERPERWATYRSRRRARTSKRCSPSAGRYRDKYAKELGY